MHKLSREGGLVMEKWIKGDSRNDASLFPLFLMTESATVEMQKALGVGVSGLMISFHEKTWIYYEIKGEFLGIAKELMGKIENDPNFVEDAIESTYKIMAEVLKLTEKVYKEELKSKSDEELLNYYFEYCREIKKARGYGWIAPALDISGAFSEKLEGILKEHLKGRNGEIPKYFNALTHPSKETLMRKEEKELLKLCLEAERNAEISKIFKEAKNEVEILKELESTQPDFYLKLKSHYEEYLWLPCIFEGDPWKIEYFISLLGEMANGKRNAQGELDKLEGKKRREDAEKAEAFGELKLSKEESHLFELAQEILHFKAERKDLYQKSYFQINPLMIEFARRIGISLQQVRFLLPEELKKALLEKKVDAKLLDERHKFSVLISENDSSRVYVGEEAKRILEEEVEKPELREELMELKGQCANPGVAKGVVKQILSPSDMLKMEKGNILVAQATNPDVVPAMKKAAGIITNTGGITCHAAIVSRELGIPCIVGTKIATDVLKDGMEVEMDASKGIVKIVRK